MFKMWQKLSSEQELTRKSNSDSFTPTDYKKIENLEQKNEKKKGIFNQSITEHREKLVSVVPELKALNDIPFIDMLVPVGNNVKIPIRIYTSPKVKNEEKIPTVFYVPGTGFVAAEIKFTHVTCTHVCYLTQCRVIVINHRLAPENQFPAAFLDAYGVLQFFVKPESRNLYGIDINKIVIAGYSSGGNIAALMAIQAAKDGIPVRKQILISPIVDLSRTLPGFKAYEEKDTDISSEFVHWVIGLYLPPHENPRNPDASPFWKKSSELKGIPSADFILAQNDRCRSDSELYWHKLKNENIPVEKFIKENANHSHLWHNIKVTEKFAERIEIAVKDISIGRPLSNTLSHIHLRNKEKREDHENQQALIPAPTARF